METSRAHDEVGRVGSACSGIAQVARRPLAMGDASSTVRVASAFICYEELELGSNQLVPVAGWEPIAGRSKVTPFAVKAESLAPRNLESR